MTTTTSGKTIRTLKEKSNTNSTISIIIPLYNEEKTIKKVLNRIPNHNSYQIIVINDGSTDRSVEYVKDIRTELNMKNIHIFSHKKNRGYGAAILNGFNKAEGDIIMTLDSDGQHDPCEISRLIQPLLDNEADLTIGSRYLGKCFYSIPIYTRMGEFFVNAFLYLFFGQTVGNNQSGFRAIRREHLHIFKDISFTNFGFCTEVLFKAAASGLTLKEVPISVKARKHGDSSVNLFKVLVSILTCILKYGLNRFNLLKFIPNFMKKMFLKVSRG